MLTSSHGVGGAILPAPGPWASGPAEILMFASSLIDEADESKRRIGMILVDNAVELAAKVYVGLPKRANGLALSRRVVEEASGSFARVLDLLEDAAPEALEGINLSDLEWYHRLRNQLYHEGNGLTVEQEKARAFVALAKALHMRLFGALPDESGSVRGDAVGDFVNRWAQLNDPRNGAARTGEMSAAKRATFDAVRAVRNKVAHGEAIPTGDDFARLRQLEEWHLGVPRSS